MSLTALDAFKSLENDLAEVKYAAALAAGLLNHFPQYEKRPDGYVSLTLSLDELEQLDFAVYEVHRRAKVLNETYQAIEIAEEAVLQPRGRKSPGPDVASVARIRPNDLIRHIDVLGEAEDRIIALQTMVDGMPDRQISSAFSYAVGDVQGLVTSVRDALNALHAGGAE